MGLSPKRMKPTPRARTNIPLEISLGLRETVEERTSHARPVFELLRTDKRVRDAFFDKIYPPSVRKFSRRHWTPVEVAKRAAELLVHDSKTRILDVGSGVGKFCLVGALTSPGHFFGIEQREHFAKFANNLIEHHKIPRVKFIHGNMEDLDWNTFSGFYLYNPFYENVADNVRIDRVTNFSQERYDRYIEIVRAKLKALRVGTRVVTYHGFGGDFPPGFTMVLKEPHGTGLLEFWVKDRV